MIIKYKLHRVRLNKDGYELPKGERYWGIGMPLWRYELSTYKDRKSMEFMEQVNGEVRASSKPNALSDLKAKYYYYPNYEWLKVTGPPPSYNCKFGHPLIGNNVILDPENNTRHCRKCANINYANHRRAKRIKTLNEMFQEFMKDRDGLDFGTFFYDKVMLRRKEISKCVKSSL